MKTYTVQLLDSDFFVVKTWTVKANGVIEAAFIAGQQNSGKNIAHVRVI